jgi:type II secretory pathway pseudopilin PulG
MKQQGFTIIEMLLVVAVMMIITVVAAPLYANLNNSNQLDAASSILVQDLYQAQTFSRNRSRDTSWGVAVNGQVITLFSGTTYATRDTASDITYIVPSAIQLSGTNQIVYSKLYGLPTTTGSFGLTANGKTINVTVNNKGMVEY